MKRILSLGLVTPSFKRFFSLFVLLLMSVSALAQETQVFTVNTTVSTTTSSTGNTGSFLDAVNKVNKEGGSWRIEFACNGEIELTSSVRIENFDKLKLVGNNQTTILFNNGTDANFTIINGSLKNVEIEKLKFKVSGFIKEWYINIASFFECEFHNLALISKSNHIRIIKDCTFYNSQFRDANYSNILGTNTQIDTLSGCKFNKDGKGNSCFQFMCLGTVIGSEFNSMSINNCKVNRIDSCTFSSGVITNILCDSITNSIFDSNCCSWIKITDAVTNPFINVIKDCKFTGDVKNAIDYETYTPIGEISNCRFSSINKSFSLGLNFNGIKLEKDTFDIVNPQVCINNKAIGYYSQNIFLPQDVFSINPINNDESLPIISQVKFFNGKYQIEGFTNDEATIELFLSDGSQSSAVQYLVSVETVKNNGKFSFTAEIPAKVLTYAYSCFVATATYDGKRTSGLSKPVCATFPDNIFVTQTGTGSGESWEDPMGPNDFCSILPLVKNGTNFYVGAGEYNYNLPKSSRSCILYIKSNVNIYGGFPENGGETQNPSKYKTIYCCPVKVFFGRKNLG